MTDYEKIESYVDDLLNLSGVVNGEGERPVWLLLHHLYCAVAMFSLMNDSERALIKGVQRRLKYFFSFNVSIKQRRRKTEKEILPPVPLTLEKENKEKEEKTREIAGREISVPFSDFEVRKNAFRQECWARREKMDVQMLGDFFNYWSDENPKTHRMRFEELRYWNIDSRMARWKTNQFSSENRSAAIRLKKTRQKMAQEQQAEEQTKIVATEREQENAEREAKTAQSKQEQMLTEDYIREHPDSLMAKIYRQKKKKT